MFTKQILCFFAILGDRIVGSITVFFFRHITGAKLHSSLSDISNNGPCPAILAHDALFVGPVSIHTLYIFNNSFSEIKHCSPRNKNYQEYICIYV